MKKVLLIIALCLISFNVEAYDFLMCYNSRDGEISVKCCENDTVICCFYKDSMDFNDKYKEMQCNTKTIKIIIEKDEKNLEYLQPSLPKISTYIN